ncbi:MAG TPA: energy transducer TonB [Verrucomicrobiae bacterium]|nr:energy transducer TonB [Verrucomicrobiae bacterium]
MSTTMIQPPSPATIPGHIFFPKASPSRVDSPAPAFAFDRRIDLNRTFLASHRMPSASHRRTLTVSILLHVVLLAVPILVSLWFTDALDFRTYTKTLLIGPPPPPPVRPPAAASAVARTTAHRVLVVNGKLMAPRAIPSRIAMLREEPLPPEADTASGVAGGIWGGLPSAAFSAISPAAKSAPAPPAEKPTAPIRVGGKVLPPRAVYAPPPAYPVLARQARVEGEVVLDATFDAQGTVTGLTVVSGPGLLYAAALQAVKTWRYEPVYLNGVPMPFQMEVTVHFHMY